MIDLILDRPNLQSKRQRLVFGGLTMLFWALWIYLWLPALALLGWLLGFKIAYYQMVVRHGYAGLLRELGFYAMVVGCLGGALLLWAYYNYFKFRGVVRRTQVTTVGCAELSRRYAIPVEVLERWRRERRVVMQHDAAGGLRAPDTDT